MPSAMLGWRFSRKNGPDGTDKKPYGSWRTGDSELAVLAAYADEVLSDPVPLHATRADVRRHPPIKQLYERYRARIEFSGICVDLLSLRMELCTVLVIPDPRWYEEVIRRPNSEYAEVEEVSLHDESKAYDLFVPGQTTPAGAATFCMGIRHVQNMLGYQSTSRKRTMPLWLEP
jgi:hypothetical protein